MTSNACIEQAPLEVRKLYETAQTVRANSYSPYSSCRVGAALRTVDGAIYVGCNVENASYGATICAERAAILAAVGAQGKLKIAEMLVLSDASPPWPPCGECLQVIAEFAAANTLVHCANEAGEWRSTTFERLLPQAFGIENLGQANNS